jgi:hypothetical protein
VVSQLHNLSARLDPVAAAAHAGLFSPSAGLRLCDQLAPTA